MGMPLEPNSMEHSPPHTPAVRAQSGGLSRRLTARLSREAVDVGVVSLATGAVLEWVAPAWGVLPHWLRVAASANEPLMIGGAVLMATGVIVGRRVRRALHADASGDVPANAGALISTTPGEERDR